MSVEWLQISEAARRLGVSPKTLRRWDDDGILPARRHPVSGRRVYSVEAVRQRAGSAQSSNHLFGRERELEELERAFADGTSSVVIVGLAGVGKTTLARAFCAQAGAPIVDCPVAGLQSLPDLIAAIGRVIGARDSAPDAILERLVAREGVIVLLDDVGALDTEASHWVAAASSRVSMLMTTRARPAFVQARLLRLGPLAHPRAGTRDDHSPAVAMAVARLQAHGLAHVDDALRVDATEIARRVEGHPQAIELAAARAATLGSAHVRRELEQRAIPRGASLEVSILESLDGLNGAERELLATLVRLPGRLDLGDLLLLVDPDGDVADSLQVLVARSLVQTHQVPHAPTEIRYSLHVLVREIAAGALTPASVTAFEERLWQWAVSVAGTYLDSRSTHLLARVARSAGMLERAWHHLSAGGEHENEAATIAAALAALMSIHGPTPELVELVTESAESGADAALRSELVRQLALRDLERSNPSAAIERLTLAAELAARGECPAQGARALAQLAGLVARTGDFDAAGEHLDAAEALAGQQAHPQMLVGAVRTFIALLAGRRGDARREVERYRALAIKVGDVAFEASAASHLGNIAHDEGRREEAAAHYARGLELALDPRYEPVFSTPLVTHFVGYRAITLHELGDPEALAFCEEAIRRAQAARSVRFEALFEAWRGVMLAARGRVQLAERALDLADATSEAIRPVTAVLRAHVELARSRELAGSDRWRAWAHAARRWTFSSPAQAAASRDLRVARRNVEARVLADMPDGPAEPAFVCSWDGVARREAKEFDCSNRATLRALLLELVLVRLAEPGATLSVDALVRVGWPDETLVGGSGARRVQVAISTLRKHLLGDDLETIDGEYRLSADSTVVVVGPSE